MPRLVARIAWFDDCYGATAWARSTSEARSSSVSTRTIGRSTAERYGASASTTCARPDPVDADGARRRVHRGEVRGRQLAVPPLFVVQPLCHAATDHQARMYRAVIGAVRPAATAPSCTHLHGSRTVGRQHPVEQHTIGGLAAEATQVGAHRADHDPRHGQRVAQLPAPRRAVAPAGVAFSPSRSRSTASQGRASAGRSRSRSGPGGAGRGAGRPRRDRAAARRRRSERASRGPRAAGSSLDHNEP